MEFVLTIDRAALLAANGAVGFSGAFDRAVTHVLGSPIFKGTVPMMILWGLWFADRGDAAERRARLIGVIVVACAAIATGRALALLLPFRLRPMHVQGLDLEAPAGFGSRMLEGWSSMPSDHAVLYFALAMGLWGVSRLWGAVALLHAALLVALPRVVVGLHFPSDVVVGALVGVAMAALLGPAAAALARRSGLIGIERARPALFYAALFAVTFQVASMFESLRSFLSGVAGILLA